MPRCFSFGSIALGSRSPSVLSGRVTLMGTSSPLVTLDLLLVMTPRFVNVPVWLDAGCCIILTSLALGAGLEGCARSFLVRCNLELLNSIGTTRFSDYSRAPLRTWYQLRWNWLTSEDIFLFAREASVRHIVWLFSPVALILPAISKAFTYRKRYSFVTSQS